MAWNDSGNGKNPWQRDNDGPNDLDRIFANFQKRLGGLLGGRGDGKGSGKNGGTGLILLILALVAWSLTGFYRVDEAERGVVQRFGKYTHTTLPGLHWHLPYPIEVADLVNTSAVSNYPFQTEMLTADLQYVFIEMVVQFRRVDPVKYSFEVVEPDLTLRDVTESALREVVGTSTLEVLVTGNRDQIAHRTQDVLQSTLDSYKSGIDVTSISLETVDYPKSVQSAVDDAQKARNDSDRYILEADAYARDVVPRAHGDAARIMQDASAYKDRVVADADGESARFLSLLTEYEKAPRVTRDRLYIDALEDVYSRSHKVLIDSNSTGNMLYLPIDKLLQAGKDDKAAASSGSEADAQTKSQQSDMKNDLEARERRVRQ